MAGKTRIDGTVYSIKGGKTRIDGTAYTIKQGKTRIDGTVYTITLASGKTLTIIGADGDFANVSVNSTYKTDGTYTYSDSNTIKAWVYAKNSSYSQYCRVYLNDTLVKSGEGSYSISNPGQYSNIKIEFKWQNYNTYVWCYITAT